MFPASESAAHGKQIPHAKLRQLTIELTEDPDLLGGRQGKICDQGRDDFIRARSAFPGKGCHGALGDAEQCCVKREGI